MEKTFEELIENHAFYDRSDYAKKEPLLDKADVLQLMQQVREATIEECKERIIELEGHIYREGITEVFDEFKTDRIKITDENRKGN